jgi:hypothetical protein
MPLGFGKVMPRNMAVLDVKKAKKCADHDKD